jgi:hypothetical protein
VEIVDGGGNGGYLILGTGISFSHNFVKISCFDFSHIIWFGRDGGGGTG